MALRTLQELKAPFQNATTSVRQTGLNLVKEPEESVIPCFAKTFWQQKLQSGKHNKACPMSISN